MNKKKALIEIVKELVSEEAVEIALYLVGKEKISEFIIAEEVGYEIHKTRSLLYKLLEENVVSFVRKKDKIKGWYICYWDLKEDNIPVLLDKIRKKKIKELEGRLEREEGNQFYLCKNACNRMDFDKAMEFDFKCPECGELMDVQDNKRTIEFLKDKIADLKEKTDSSNQKQSVKTQ